MKKPNTMLKDKFMIFCFIWGILLYILGFALSKFYLFSIGLLPFAAYEAFRTEGEKNTKPLSFLMIAVLVLQFLHTTGIFLFPIDITFLFDILPFEMSASSDPIVLASIIALVIMSFMLIKYTWGSITKFLAIALLVGSLLQGLVFWSDIESFLDTDEGQTFIDESQDEIEDNIIYRIKQELF